MSDRRLSQAIAEGDGISVLVEVGEADEILTAAEYGAEGIVLRGAREIGEIGLPVLTYGLTPESAAQLRADAIVLVAEEADGELGTLAERAADLGLECVFRVRNEDDLERVLDLLDPEVLLLAADDAGEGQPPFERVLELLPGVPVGKLAIAELPGASRSEVEELERAGVDAVIVAGHAGDLVGVAPPDV